jgi:hypothetical protein
MDCHSDRLQCHLLSISPYDSKEKLQTNRDGKTKAKKAIKFTPTAQPGKATKLHKI